MVSLDRGSSGTGVVVREATKAYDEALVEAMAADNRTHYDPLGDGGTMGVSYSVDRD